MKKGRMDEAFRSMNRLRDHPIIAARDFYYSYVIYQEELREARGAGYFARLWDCFAVPRIRRGNYGASTVMIAQQMCGINSELLSNSRDGIVLTQTQSFPSTARQFSSKSVTRPHRRCTPRLATVQFRSSSQFRHSSSSTPRVDVLSV